MQQELLKASRDHINFESLHEKYSNNDKTTHELDVFSLGTEYKEDELAKSHVLEDDEGDNKSFPGRNILKKESAKISAKPVTVKAFCPDCT